LIASRADHLPDVIRHYHAKYFGIRVRVIDESSSVVLTVVAEAKLISADLRIRR
jgi:hypothetical protein